MSRGGFVTAPLRTRAAARVHSSGGIARRVVGLGIARVGSAEPRALRARASTLGAVRRPAVLRPTLLLLVVRRILGIGAFPLLGAAHGEFELVFGVPPGRLAALGDLARALDWSPIPLGPVREGEGLHVGGASIDGARIRNLLRESGGDLQRYVASLVTLGRDLP